MPSFLFKILNLFLISLAKVAHFCESSKCFRIFLSYFHAI